MHLCPPVDVLECVILGLRWLNTDQTADVSRNLTTTWISQLHVNCEALSTTQDTYTSSRSLYVRVSTLVEPLWLVREV